MIYILCLQILHTFRLFGHPFDKESNTCIQKHFIIARDERDLIGTADHDRFIVKKEAFEAKALSKLENS